MRDMKSSIPVTNLTVTRVDWSFVSEVFGNTVVNEGLSLPE